MTAEHRLKQFAHSEQGTALPETWMADLENENGLLRMVTPPLCCRTRVRRLQRTRSQK